MSDELFESIPPELRLDLGLLDHDSAVQRALELLGEDRGAVDGALLEDPDGGHIGQCAGDPLVRDA